MEAGAELVEPGAERIEGLVDRDLEQRFPAFEVVVEGAEPDVRRLRDLEDGDMVLPGTDEALGGLHQRGTGPGLAPLTAVGRASVAVDPGPRACGPRTAGGGLHDCLLDR